MRKRITVSMLAALLMLLASCGTGADQAEIKLLEKAPSDMAGRAAENLSVSSAKENRNADLEFDGVKSIAVAVVKDKSYGSFSIGNGAEGFTERGSQCQLLDCDVLYFYNYDRLREAAEADGIDTTYMYFKIGGMVYGGSKGRSEDKDAFDGNLTDTFIQNLKARGREVTYSIYLDWDYKDEVEVGDTILIAVDPQLTINPNYLTGAYEIKSPRSYFTVVAPFQAESPEPYLAKFKDGRLVLPAGLSEAITLRRLYDDTYPELTGIKDGDSVEDVVNFLKAVEQDMVRYEQELRQRPASTDVSSIR